MAIVQGRAIWSRSTDGGVGGMAAAPHAVGGVQEDALGSILHHVGLDLSHHLHWQPGQGQHAQPVLWTCTAANAKVIRSHAYMSGERRR